jgi:hypothetical protein
MRVFVIIIAASLQTMSVWSQSFRGNATLPPVGEDGFYRVAIGPDVAVHLNASFTNIRIYDNQGKEVPYMFQEERPNATSQEFKEYKILEMKHQQGCCTSVILHNPDRNAVNTINLVIKNAEVTKEAVLLGSDDQQHWFALKQRFVLHPTANSSGTSEIKIVDFPLSNYSYFSLQINDSTSAPLNILGAGYFESVTTTGKYTEVALQKVTKTDSLKQKKTYIHFQFDTLRTVDLLELSMTGPAFFLRKASLYVRMERTLRTGVSEAYYDRIKEVILSSKHPTGIELPGMKVNDLLLVIENEDNPLLEIDYARSFMLNRYLVTFLKKDQDYTIKIGDETLQAPVYDLRFFQESIPNNPPVLSIRELTIFEKSKVAPAFTFFTTKAFIWATVVLVILILGFMSVRLLKDVGSAGNE